MIKEGCLFCDISEDRIVTDNMFAVAIYDNYPVTPYHTLIIPKRHVINFFDLTKEEMKDVFELLKEVKNRVLSKDDRITGWNVGVNVLEDAGQTIMHVHIHLIPRRKGDMEDPRGGVRGVIPEKQSY